MAVNVVAVAVVLLATTNTKLRGRRAQSPDLPPWMQSLSSRASSIAPSMFSDGPETGHTGLPSDAPSAEASRLQQQRRLVVSERERILADHNRVAKLDVQKGARPRVGVCVTGKLERLEMESKVRLLIDVLVSEGYDVDVALALTPDAATLANTTAMGLVGAATQATLAAVPGRHFFDVNGSWQFEEPFLRPDFVKASAKGAAASPWPPQEKRAAARAAAAHLQSWRGLWTCFRHFVQVEVATSTLHSHHVVLKDDVVVVRPFYHASKPAFSHLAVVTKKTSVASPGCGELDTDVLVLDGSYGPRFFLQPLWQYYFGYEAVLATHAAHARAAGESDAITPEKFFVSVLELTGLHLRTVSADEMPVVGGRGEPFK